jgi:hypothetical protein
VSATLDAFLDPARLAQMLANDEAMGVQPTKLQAFIILIKNGPRITRNFEAMGASRVAVQMQHEVLCGPGEYCWVMTAEEAKAVRS